MQIYIFILAGGIGVKQHSALLNLCKIRGQCNNLSEDFPLSLQHVESQLNSTGGRRASMIR